MTMRRRRVRHRDELANVAAVRAILEVVREQVMSSKSLSERDLVHLLQAASHCDRRAWQAAERGRRSRFPRRLLLEAWAALEVALRRGTSRPIARRTFVEQYLRLLACPADVLEALEKGQLNLFEALQLSRVRGDSMGVAEAEAVRLRRRLLRAHLAEQGSTRRMYERIDEVLGVSRRSGAGDRLLVAGDEETDELAGGLFGEQLRAIAAELDGLEPELLTEAESASLLEHLDELYLKVSRIARRQSGGG